MESTMTVPAAPDVGEIAAKHEEELRELAEGLEHAAKVAWRWLKDDKSPWERSITLRMVAGLSRNALAVRQHLAERSGK